MAQLQSQNGDRERLGSPAMNKRFYCSSICLVIIYMSSHNIVCLFVFSDFETVDDSVVITAVKRPRLTSETTGHQIPCKYKKTY